MKCRMTWLQDMPDLGPPMYFKICKLDSFKAYPGGCTNLALYLSKQYPRHKIAIVIAGNSGRPGGACGHLEMGRPTVKNLHHKHKTQEEDVLSNWLLTHKEVRNANVNSIFESTIGGDNRWGMVYPDWTASEEGSVSDDDIKFSTIQGVKYTNAEPRNYYDAWHVSNCLVSQKTTEGFLTRKNVDCSLVFVSGPLANNNNSLHRPDEPGNYSSTQFRTFNQNAYNDFHKFISCVEYTFEAALTAMAAKKESIAVLCHVSGGIYAGNYRKIYGDESDYTYFEKIIYRVLNKKLTNGYKLGMYFEKVVFAPYRPPKEMKKSIAKTAQSNTSKRTGMKKIIFKHQLAHTL